MRRHQRLSGHQQHRTVHVDIGFDFLQMCEGCGFRAFNLCGHVCGPQLDRATGCATRVLGSATGSPPSENASAPDQGSVTGSPPSENASAPDLGSATGSPSSDTSIPVPPLPEIDLDFLDLDLDTIPRVRVVFDVDENDDGSVNLIGYGTAGRDSELNCEIPVFDI